MPGHCLGCLPCLAPGLGLFVPQAGGRGEHAHMALHPSLPRQGFMWDPTTQGPPPRDRLQAPGSPS